MFDDFLMEYTNSSNLVQCHFKYYGSYNNVTLLVNVLIKVSKPKPMCTQNEHIQNTFNPFRTNYVASWIPIDRDGMEIRGHPF